MTARKKPALAAVADDNEPTEYVATKTIAEVMDSLNGYDDLAIEDRLGRSLEQLSDDESGKANSLLLTRACVAKYRQSDCGDNPSAAWKFAMSLGLNDLMGYFPPKSTDEEMGLEDTSASGKDEPQPAAAPVTKPGSAS